MSVLRPVERHFLPGCAHEVAHRALAAALEGLASPERVVGISGVGCGSLIHDYLKLPFVASPAGRGVSVARGILLVQPERIPVVYGGDGELFGEGLADLLRAAAADAAVLVVLVDNGMHARTARVHSATTPLGVERPSCPAGRLAGRHSRPLDPAELLGGLGVPVLSCDEGDGDVLVDAFREALQVVSDRRRMAVVHVRGGCAGEGRGRG